jgi:hypothetical protein
LNEIPGRAAETFDVTSGVNATELLIGRAPERNVHAAGASRDRVHRAPSRSQAFRPFGVRLGRAVFVEKRVVDDGEPEDAH